MPKPWTSLTEDGPAHSPFARRPRGPSSTPGRLLPERAFPPYAYLPGRHPHPVRDPDGHSYGLGEATRDADGLRWGLDLFNHGYPWEAHEAWEPMWFAAERGSALRSLYKGLILLAAASVKIREGKGAPALRHAERAAALLRRATGDAAELFRTAAGLMPSALADRVDVSLCGPLKAHGSADPDLVIEA